MSASAEAELEAVELFLPAQTRYLRLARLTASGFVADLGGAFEALEELRLGVDEACAVLVEHAAEGARIQLTYSVDGDSLVITGRTTGRVSAPAVPHAVTAAVLAATLDSSEFFVDDEGRQAFRLQKHLPSAG